MNQAIVYMFCGLSISTMALSQDRMDIFTDDADTAIAEEPPKCYFESPSSELQQLCVLLQIGNKDLFNDLCKTKIKCTSGKTCGKSQSCEVKSIKIRCLLTGKCSSNNQAKLKRFCGAWGNCLQADPCPPWAKCGRRGRKKRFCPPWGNCAFKKRITIPTQPFPCPIMDFNCLKSISNHRNYEESVPTALFLEERRPPCLPGENCDCKGDLSDNTKRECSSNTPKTLPKASPNKRFCQPWGNCLHGK